MLESVDLPQVISEITEEVIDSLQDSEVSSYSFYTSNDICALVMLEFDYMCANNMEIRRCANCDGYFHPFSNRAIYCDRIFKNDKMCKELAAAVKYREAAKKDEASEYFRRLQNTYNMRCQRSGDFTMMDRRDDWKAMAQEKLQEFHAGEITLEEFKEAIKLPQIR